MKRIMLSAGLFVAFAALAVPKIEDVSVVQDTDGEVTVSYTLSDEDAVVVFDVLSGGTPLGGEVVRDVAPASDCWKVVSPGERTIQWRPHVILPADGGALSVRVSAWSLDNPPPVMVVDLVAGTASSDRVRYYPSVEHLPGGLFENAAYRTSKLVLKKVVGAGKKFMMSQTASGGFEASLTRNYYLGVFEFTQGQFSHFSATLPNGFTVNRAMRPLETIAFNEVRCNAIGSVACVGGVGPADAPYAASLLGLIRARTGVAVDLPTEAEWEFACRAGWTLLHWGNGETLSTTATYDSNMPGRHRYNGGYVGGTTSPTLSVDVDNGTAIVGSYAPNSWGFYDMHGNVFEYCIDWFESDITGYGGAVNVDSDEAARTLSGATGTNRVRRGGAWHVGPGDNSPWNRLGCDPATRSQMWGFRLSVAAGTAQEEGPAACDDGALGALDSVGGAAASSADALEARQMSVLESLAVGIKATLKMATTLLLR